MQELQIREGAEEFELGSGPTGALLVHGFTGSPRSMRGLGEHLAAAGLSVRGVRLPGHGTTWQDLNSKKAEDWSGAVDKEFANFASGHDELFVVALSFGGALALDLAARNPGKIAGLVLLAPFVLTKDPLRFLAPVMPKLIKSLPGVGNDICLEGQDELCYDKLPTVAAAHMLKYCKNVRAELPKVTAPLLVMHSRNDHTSPPASSQFINDNVGSTDKELVWLDRSYHVITMDHDRDDVFRRTQEFIQKRSTGGLT
ncbi:MAG: carboxylesterase [Actinomycetota bacterium]|nr:carboxylesterase [Actinomycetota bacterium]